MEFNMSRKASIGIDPGKDGAIVIIYPSGEIEALKFPFIGKEYDIQTMSEMFALIAESPDVHIVIEDVKALQKPMDRGNWSLSRGKAILETLCVSYGIPHTLVHSKIWQKEMWQGVPIQREPSKGNKKGKVKTKTMSLLAAKKLFPRFDLRGEVEVQYYADNANNRKLGRVGKEIPSKKVNADEGIVDAILISEYCRRKFS